MIRIALLLFLPIFCFAQPVKKYKRSYGFDDLNKVPSPPDYSQLAYWVAHPEQKDMADVVPGRGELVDYQASAEVDVFFIYPTIHSKKQQKNAPWFADVTDEKLNKRIANSTIKNQATVFNSSCKVYAPLYRQAHLAVYYQDSLALKVEALEFAYGDVREAFRYYMKHWNDGRPVVIASHSQGTTHAVKLLREFFDEKPLADQLVAAYLVGMPLSRGSFNALPICESAEETGCWVSWNTFLSGYYPPNHGFWYNDALSVNPLSWKTDSTHISFGANKGGVLRNYKKLVQGVSDAKNQDGMLWIHKPRFFGNFLLNWQSFHKVDYNLFYMNIRENVEQRVEHYLEENGKL